jgi:hypothetical protein
MRVHLLSVTLQEKDNIFLGLENTVFVKHQPAAFDAFAYRQINCRRF